jgi:large repetitive protein
MANGDVFIFDSPIININGNVTVNANGSGKIIIPWGVSVVIDGNFRLDAKRPGCSQANTCAFEIEVNGSIHFAQNFQNTLSGVIWSGTGTVAVDNHFDNLTNGCMSCDGIACPDFQVSSANCKDRGANCSGNDFCTIITPCSSDTVPPVITGCPLNSTYFVESGCSQIVTWLSPTASDNCNLVSLKAAYASATEFPIGNTTVTYTAIDAMDNISTSSFVISVLDTLSPAITDCPGDIIVNATDSCRAVVDWIPPSFKDNCDGVTIISNLLPGSVFGIGVTRVTYTATDASGNSSSCSFNIVVNPKGAPIITKCPEDILLLANEDGTAYASWEPPAALGYCGDVDMVGSHQPGENFGIGSTQVEYRATDREGNAAYCTFNIHVSDPVTKIFVAQIVTPDGDGTNDQWIISNIEKFKDNEVILMDRWGGVIFSETGYDNKEVVWTGVNRSGQLVPNGTYFYMITVKNNSSETNKKGFIEVVR